tara:strand:+ start:387 stop:560 length:174 start_codon:yes stop_codon:yes gene_type:complete
MKKYFTNRFYSFPVKDRGLYDKMTFICGGEVTDHQFYNLIKRLIEKEYEASNSPLGI